MKTSDSELIRETLAGRREAFAALVDRYRDGVCALAYTSLGNFDDAQDVAQEVFVYAYLHLGELREPDRFGAWPRRIAMSRCADRLRRREHRHLSPEQVAEAGGVGVELPYQALSGPDEGRLATRMVVQEALGRLSDKTRLAVTLFYLGGYSHAEIARFLEIPLNTVRSRLRLAKRQLREEMLTMVTEVLQEGQPDPEFTRRVVEEAIRRAEEAAAAHTLGEALRHYDAALTALDRLEPGQERQRLKMETLWKKGGASRFLRGFDVAVQHYAEAAAIAEQIGDRRGQAEQLLRIGVHSQNREEAPALYQEALRIYRELGDAAGEGECLWWLANRSLQRGEAAAARRYCEQALPLLEGAGDLRLAAVCRAVLSLLEEVGEAGFPKLLAWNVSCDVLEQEGEALVFGPYSDFRRGPAETKVPAGLAVLRGRTVFAHVGHLGKILDPTVPVGGCWSGPSWSYSSQPLHTVVTVKSRTERVIVPAGAFDRCLLIEHVTSEASEPDDAPEENRRFNRESLCGTRWAWYAPGVGLVQLRVQGLNGAEGLIQLQAYEVEGAGDAPLPLSVGNRWTYTWPGRPEGRAGREVYRVCAQAGQRWHLEGYGSLTGLEDSSNG